MYNNSDLRNLLKSLTVMSLFNAIMKQNKVGAQKTTCVWKQITEHKTNINLIS